MRRTSADRLDESGPQPAQQRCLPTRRWLAVLLASCSPLLAACGSAETAGDRAATQLAQALTEAHQRALDERAAAPAALGHAAADRLGYAISGGNAAMVVSVNDTALAVDVVTMIGTRAEVGGGLSFEQTTLGACLQTRAEPGFATGDVGERGMVETQAVPCPGKAVPVVDGVPVAAVTTDLEPRRSDVPRPEPRDCLSGSGKCVGG